LSFQANFCCAMKKRVQKMLDLLYTVGRPPRRFTPSQVDQESLSIVYLALTAFVLSTVLAVTFSVWALLSTPLVEIDETSASLMENDELADDCATFRRVVGCLAACVAGGVVGVQRGRGGAGQRRLPRDGL